MRQYGTGSNSTINSKVTNTPQFNQHYWDKKSLVEAAKEQVFTPLADTTNMPKHYGKKMVAYHYLPVLDDANINDQGIDATGASVRVEKTIIISAPSITNKNIYVDRYAVGEGADNAAAVTAAEARASEIFRTELGLTGANYAALKTAAINAGWKVDDSALSVPVSGNLYGSSKDVGYIQARLPALSEGGGRVNRVGFTRRHIEGTFNKFGIFDEWTRESYEFDTDAELRGHIQMERTKAANEITEDMLQIDLLNAAGVVRYGGVAVSRATCTGETATTVSVPTYRTLLKLGIDLDNNRCPKDTTMITGSNFTDTKTVASGRIMYIGSELKEVFMAMKDLHGEPAFIDVKHYAAATKPLKGEIGSVAEFRLVVVQEMMHWDGVGATVTNNAGYRATGGKYDLFPALVVGSGSFTTIGFNTGGKEAKFRVIIKEPGEDTADRSEPYGETGFSSIRWYYGFMPLRPERIALIYSVAPW